MSLFSHWHFPTVAIVPKPEKYDQGLGFRSEQTTASPSLEAPGKGLADRSYLVGLRFDLDDQLLRFEVIGHFDRPLNLLKMLEFHLVTQSVVTCQLVESRIHLFTVTLADNLYLDRPDRFTEVLDKLPDGEAVSELTRGAHLYDLEIPQPQNPSTAFPDQTPEERYLLLQCKSFILGLFYLLRQVTTDLVIDLLRSLQNDISLFQVRDLCGQRIAFTLSRAYMLAQRLQHPDPILSLHGKGPENRSRKCYMSSPALL